MSVDNGVIKGLKICIGLNRFNTIQYKDVLVMRGAADGLAAAEIRLLQG